MEITKINIISAAGQEITIKNRGEESISLAENVLKAGDRISFRQTKRGLKRLITSGTFPPNYK